MGEVPGRGDFKRSLFSPGQARVELVAWELESGGLERGSCRQSGWGEWGRTRGNVADRATGAHPQPAGHPAVCSRVEGAATVG